VVGERGYTLSGGQRQRIAIARTLLVNPPVLILDDATSAIDVHVEQQIHRSLRSLMQGRTTLIVAHRLSTISLADRVVLIEGGRVVADGTHAELLATTPLYVEVLAQAAAEEEVEEEADWIDEAASLAPEPHDGRGRITNGHRSPSQSGSMAPGRVAHRAGNGASRRAERHSGQPAGGDA
jgi:ABC-type multidrug transport system ATPase subunit